MIVLTFSSQELRNFSSIVEGSGGSVQRLGSGLQRVFMKDSGLRWFTVQGETPG